MEIDGYSDEQRKCIKLLKERMNGLMSQDMYEDDSLFKRFLAARSYDLNAAETMLKANLKWRKANKIDSILTDLELKEVFVKYAAPNHLGFSKKGYPVSFSRYGNIDFRGLLKSLKKSELVTYGAYLLEGECLKGKIKSKETGKPADKFVFLVDLSNFSLTTATHKPTLDFMIQLVSMFDANYPEKLGTAYIVNASFYFTLFWSVLSPFLAGETFKKVKVYGKDKDSWKNDLFDEVDADIVPAYLGGGLTDPDGDPMCRTTLNHCGTIPEEYYCQRDDTFRKKCSTKKVIVNRMSKENVEIELKEPGSILEWEFEVKNRDIGFSVLFKNTKDPDAIPKEVVPHQRIETMLSSETGILRCEKAGIYVIEFDNTYSWIHSKKIYYKTSIKKSDQLLAEL